MGVNKTNCGDHFTINTNIKPLCCTLETNITFYVSCRAINKQKKRMRALDDDLGLARAPAI